MQDGASSQHVHCGALVLLSQVQYLLSTRASRKLLLQHDQFGVIRSALPKDLQVGTTSILFPPDVVA